MTNRRRFPTDHPAPDNEGDSRTEAVFVRRRTGPTTAHERLGFACLCWAWEAGYRDWDAAIRALARSLRGLERSGLVERQTYRVSGGGRVHGFKVTEAGHALLAALAAAPKAGGDR